MSSQHSVESKKKIAVLSIFVGLFLFVGSVNADTWWDSNYEKRANVTINNTDNSNTLTNYQVFVNVTYDDDMQTDFDDLRFIDDDDSTELDYWIENNVSSSYADVWINVSSIPASDTKDIIMYYGNSTVSTTGNADNTFDVYSNFSCVSDPCIDADLYNSTNAVAYQSGGKAWTNTTANENYAVIGITNALPENFSVEYESDPAIIELNFVSIVLANETYPSGGLSAGEMFDSATIGSPKLSASEVEFEFVLINLTGTPWWWNFTGEVWQTPFCGDECQYLGSFNAYNLSLKRNQTHIIWELSNQTLTKSASKARSDVRFGDDELYVMYGDVWDDYHYSSVSIDDLIVRKYQTPEPTYSIGEEETYVPPDVTPPTYSDNSTNSTLAGTPVLHSLNWTDETGLSGYIFSFDNCTGSLANDTWQSMTGLGNWSNVTKIINETVGCTIQWCAYANDTSDNWNGTSCDIPFNYTTTEPLVPLEICIQHYLEKNVYILLCNVTSISHNQNYCQDNVTLVHNITYTINETVGEYERSEYCHYGCNNESLECNPAPYEVNLWILAGIFAVMFIIITLLKLLRLI